MYVPITSEVDIETGTILKEISTGKLFTVTQRLHTTNQILGEEKWKIVPTERGPVGLSPFLFTRQELAEKYFAEVD